MADKTKSTLRKIALGSAILFPAFSGTALADVTDTATLDDVAIQLTPTQAIVQMLDDTSSLGEKLQRLEQDRSYYAEVDAVSDYATEQGWFDAPSESTFVAILHTIMNPEDVTTNALLGFDGTEQDAKDSAALDDNIADLIAAANDSENSGIQDSFMRFKSILGDVKTTATQDAYDYYADYNFDANTVHLDPSPMEHKAQRYETDESYQSAWQSSAQAMYNDASMGKMYYTNAPYFWGAYLDPEITWDILENVIDEDTEKPGEFEQWHGSYTNRDNNVQAVLDARDDILPAYTVFDLEKRAALYNSIDERAVKRISEVQTNFKAYQHDITQNQSWYLQASDKDSLSFWDYEQLRKAHTDTDISAEDLTEIGLTAENPNSYSLADNFNMVLQARETLGEDASYEDVHTLAGQLMSAVIVDSAYPFSKTTISVDMSPLDEKLARFDNDPQYERALNDLRNNYKADQAIPIADMYHNTALPKFLSSFLDRNVTWDMIKDQIDEADNSNTEFHWNMPTSNVLDNNMQFVFESRDEILPETLPTDRTALRALFQQVMDSAVTKMEEQYAPYKAYLADIESNPYFQDTDETDALSFEAYKLLQRAHTENITAEQLTAAGLIALDENSTSLAHNFNLVLEAKTALGNTASFSDVHGHAGDALLQKQDEKHQSFMTWVFCLTALGLAGAGGGAGFAAHRRYRRNNPKPNH